MLSMQTGKRKKNVKYYIMIVITVIMMEVMKIIQVYVSSEQGGIWREHRHSAGDDDDDDDGDYNFGGHAVLLYWIGIGIVIVFHSF